MLSYSWELEKTLESPLYCKEIQPVHSKGDQSWVFFGRTDAKAETPILWPPHANCWLIGKDSDAGRDWGQEEKGTTGLDGWMASPTRWTWVWVNSRSWWWTGRPGMMQFMGSQRVGHDWATKLNWTDYIYICIYIYVFVCYICVCVCVCITFWCLVKSSSDNSVGKESACNAEHLGSFPVLGRYPWEGNGNPLQYSCLVNPMDRGVWWATVHRGCKESDMTEQLT